MALPLNDGSMEDMEQCFNSVLFKRFQDGKIRNVFPLTKYCDIIRKIKGAEGQPSCSSPEEYYLLRKFVVAKVGNRERLVCRSELGANECTEDKPAKPRIYVALEEIYDVVGKAHKATNHGGRDRILRRLHEQGYVNITRDTIELFLSFCEICRPKRKRMSLRFNLKTFSNEDSAKQSSDGQLILNGDPPNEITEQDLSQSRQTSTLPPDQDNCTKPDDQENNIQLSVQNFRFIRAQVEVIDFGDIPDGDYKFIMVYLDLSTNFCLLRPLKCKCTSEVAAQLLDIFLMLGAPHILYSDNGTNFLTSIIQELKNLWSDCIILSGRPRPRYSVLQSSAEKCIADVQELIRAWMEDNKSHRWSFGLKFVQFQRNTALDEKSGKFPFESLFGFKSPLGLSSYPQICNALSNIETEEDLEEWFNDGKCDEESCEHLQVAVDPDICSFVQRDTTSNSSVRELNEKHNLQTLKADEFNNGMESLPEVQDCKEGILKSYLLQ